MNYAALLEDLKNHAAMFVAVGQPQRAVYWWSLRGLVERIARKHGATVEWDGPRTGTVWLDTSRTVYIDIDLEEPL